MGSEGSSIPPVTSITQVLAQHFSFVSTTASSSSADQASESDRLASNYPCVCITYPATPGGIGSCK